MDKQQQTKKEHEENLKLKKEEIELRRYEAQTMNTTMTSMMGTLNNTFRAQQQQMMQQTQLFASIIEKLNKY